MYDKTFFTIFGIKTSREYVGNLIRKKRGQRGYFKLPPRAELPKRMLNFRLKYVHCIENSSQDARDVYAQRIELRFIGQNVGYGAFAKEDIPAGPVGIYTGELKKVSRYSNSRYLFSFTTKILHDIMIDGEKKGNWTSFINHNPSDSKKTNLIVREYYYRGLPYIIFWTNKKIKKGSQLLYDYGDSYWETLEMKPKRL